MKKKAIMISKAMIITVMVILLLPHASFAEPRAQKIKLMCGTQLEHNTTLYVPNFVATMENISAQIRVAGFGLAETGSAPDRNYGLAQCYGDLSLVDCVLCYAEARTVLPQCYPVNGGRIYLDGCFMRAENYSFYEEYEGPNDHVCGNITRIDSAFGLSVRQAMSQAVSAAERNNGYGRAEVAVAGTRNESAYVLADCWRTVSVSGCRACLENASATLSGCLPSTEGRALNTGCFMRYSDIDFLNPVPQGVLPDGREIAVKRLFFNNKHRAADFFMKTRKQESSTEISKRATYFWTQDCALKSRISGWLGLSKKIKVISVQP